MSSVAFAVDLRPFLLVRFPRACVSYYAYGQLKNYEQAVIEKRFSELEDEEVDALLDEVNEP